MLYAAAAKANPVDKFINHNFQMTRWFLWHTQIKYEIFKHFSFMTMTECPETEYDAKELMWILKEKQLFQKFFNWKLFIDGTSCTFLVFIQIKVLIDSFILKSTIIIKNYEGSTGINSEYLYFKPKLQQYLKRGFPTSQVEARVHA